ncbi:MAG: hypothetical protein A3J09_00875 [Candidatus Zambryskibacteria bacterium RIFCSPLOWO2_02_FULL_51_21]|uniref:GGDEF domain-containing protein n=1 Tax=Candidatus Zambryskibacteria bacterium RIFCSPHIGHO2_02_FULL_43_37 TaxID=1802749 RepID=A0A1G2THS7_9BACT|nr:MAG: hypothetical protein A2723_00875 [Candidatus Zambryskibacteria bacterium RIFCSPHIGHO2_01_FULL_52_18]OHA96752.1 MAG: hypothetical protein A3D49_02835 [Candidatus Zambryskibacteria bacterium RIFCSPHIGHO2_02_FULL_43_37]OHB07445.1 MAG: hypothetical protein A2944_01905 [Candidatus Zambryskibacteria bacterium RIFCSPLOWO2_01_FULL_52_12]OHB11108.1 MAG: hypothetical protein A3J09_00875 [Candidatus Zambryskibacteria bacterium RIFCSPLOWO2_02_FULL_51_21]
MDKDKLITELQDEIVRLEDNLIHDNLTGLKTRAFLEHELSVYLEIIKQSSSVETQRRERFGFKNLSLIFLDIDFFKKVNDAHGHDIGDLVLKRVAESVASNVRTGDTVARWGGEEMVVSLLGASEKDAVLKAEEIRAKVEELGFPEASGLEVTMSAGVASSENGLTLEDLVKRADEALYKAKETGRNKVVSYSECGIMEPVTS